MLIETRTATAAVRYPAVSSPIRLATLTGRGPRTRFQKKMTVTVNRIAAKIVSHWNVLLVRLTGRPPAGVSARYRAVRYGPVRCGPVRCGPVRCGPVG